MLRLTKAPRGGKVDLSDERAEIVKRLSYENNVIVSTRFSCPETIFDLVANTVKIKRQNVTLWAIGLSAS